MSLVTVASSASSEVSPAADLLRRIEATAQAPLPRLGQALIEMGCITEPDLGSALAAQRRGPHRLLGEQLLTQGRISARQLDAALNRRLGFTWVDVRTFEVQTSAIERVPLALCRRLQALPLLMIERQLIVAMADPKRQADIDELAWAAECWVQPVLGQADSIRDRLESWARQTQALAPSHQRTGGVPAAAPMSLPAASGRTAVQASPSDALESARRWLAELEQQAGDEDEDEKDPEHLAEENENALVKLINGLIVEAHAAGASDIHVECRPGREKVTIRLRRDGRLQAMLELPHTLRSALVARLKIMCGLDVSERRRPQDGRIHFARQVPDRPLELRMVTIPTQLGLEDVVLRLLSNAEPMPLDRLGLHPRNLQRFRQAVERPHGLILCAGPTGSGKTTTLHSALAHLNTPDRKIWTAEDPIEITQSGLRQVQVNPRIEWTFEKALRAFLRADPDVIMVGEIRDRETARTAVEAALTGHLVLSTIHTNSAAETITRLLDMGLDPFNFGDSLLAVMGQRLVRGLCRECLIRRPATAEEIQEWLADHRKACDATTWQDDGGSLPQPRDQGVSSVQPSPPDQPTDRRSRASGEVLADWQRRFAQGGHLLVHHAPGCAACEQTGYQGRIGLHEVLRVTPEIRRLVHRREPLERVLDLAMRQGMLTLHQDGIEKVLQGLTSMAEVRATING